MICPNCGSECDPDWEITAESEEQTYFDLEYAFVKYERKDR